MISKSSLQKSQKETQKSLWQAANVGLPAQYLLRPLSTSEVFISMTWTWVLHAMTLAGEYEPAHAHFLKSALELVVVRVSVLRPAGSLGAENPVNLIA